MREALKRKFTFKSSQVKSSQGTTAIALKEVTKQLAEVTSELKHYKTIQVTHAHTLGKIQNTLGTSWEAAIRSQATAKPTGRRAPASAPPARRAKSSAPSVDTVSVDGDTDDEAPRKKRRGE